MSRRSKSEIFTDQRAIKDDSDNDKSTQESKKKRADKKSERRNCFFSTGHWWLKRNYLDQDEE